MQVIDFTAFFLWSPLGASCGQDFMEHRGILLKFKLSIIFFPFVLLLAKILTKPELRIFGDEEEEES